MITLGDARVCVCVSQREQSHGFCFFNGERVGLEREIEIIIIIIKDTKRFHLITMLELKTAQNTTISQKARKRGTQK